MQSPSTFNTAAVTILSLSTHAIADIFAIRTTTTTIQPNIFSLLSVIHFNWIQMVKKYSLTAYHTVLTIP